MTGLLSLDLAPGRRRRTSTRALAFTATERVIDRVHGDTPNLGSLAQPAALARLADREQLVLRVAHLAYGGETPAMDEPHLGGAKPEGDVVAFLGHNLGARAGGTRQLAALPDL